MITWVTEQQTGVSTAGFELLLTHRAAGVRSQPGVSWRILQLPTVTHVPEHNTQQGLLTQIKTVTAI